VTASVRRESSIKEWAGLAAALLFCAEDPVAPSHIPATSPDRTSALTDTMDIRLIFSYLSLRSMTIQPDASMCAAKLAEI
jgi:hypothetical protein